MAAAKESTPFIQPRVADKPSGAKAERAEISSISHAFPRALNVEGSKAGQFVIDTLGVEDEAEYYRLSGEVFAAQNVIIKELGISSSDWHKFERWDSAGFTDSGLSLAVRDLGVDGKPMVAFLAAHPFSFSRPPPSPKQLGVEEPAKLQAFFDFVAPVWIGAYMCSCPSYSGCLAAFTGRTLRIIAGGTRAGYEGRGLQMELRRTLLSLAQARGYDRIVVETISPATEHIWRDRFGFQVHGQARANVLAPLAQLDDSHKVTILELVLRERLIDTGCCCPFFTVGAILRGVCCACLLPSQFRCCGLQC